MKKSIYLLFIKLEAKHHINIGCFFRTSSIVMGGGWQLVMCRVWFFFCRKRCPVSELQRKGPRHRLRWGVRAERTEIRWKNCDSPQASAIHVEPAFCGESVPSGFSICGHEETKLWKLYLVVVLIFSASNPVTLRRKILLFRLWNISWNSAVRKWTLTILVRKMYHVFIK